MEKWEELMKKANQGQRRKSRSDEHRIQCNCVNWFRLTHPHLSMRLFAVPNGGRRDATTGRILKDEGVLAGVADLILAKPMQGYGALFIEMKTGNRGSGQSESQKAWQADVTRENEYKYVVCRSLDDFMREVKTYLIE